VDKVGGAQTEAKLERSRVNGGPEHDPLEGLRKRHRYLLNRRDRVFPIPGYRGKFGMKLRALDRDELREIGEQMMAATRSGVDDPDLIDNTDTLIRACDAIMYRDDVEDEKAWRGLHEIPSAGTSQPVRFDMKLAELFDVVDQIDTGEHAEAESRQVLWAVFADTWRVSQSHDDYMIWRTFATEDAKDEVAEGLTAEVEQEAPPGEARGAT
jgi:hypothetical protein